ncbi:hypothetical protein BASA81_015171 [Batrachochytrium salamandrivorans]|nr:hypothetical protein BASA81_015171 [Batrachochytrium salamandrivorans]
MLLKANNCRFCHVEIVEDDQVSRAASMRKKTSSQSPSPPSSDNFVFVKKSHEISLKVDNAVKRNLESYAEGTVAISHSLCSKCYDYATEGLAADRDKLLVKRQVIVASTERLVSSASGVGQVEPTKAKLAELKAKQIELERQLALGERQFNMAKQEFLSQQLAQQQALDQAQLDFTNQAIAWRQEKQLDQERQDALRARFDHSKRELTATASVINDAFFIWEDPPYFSINNMRLGRSFDNEVVEWQEVNAAWGEVCLLLHVISRKEAFAFRDYVLLPRGRQSLVQDIKTGRRYELFLAEENGNYAGSGADGPTSSSSLDTGLLHKLWSTVLSTSSSNPLDASVSTVATATAASAAGLSPVAISNLESFNQAMVAFLCCLKELGEVARESERGINLCLKGKLFPIKSHVGDASISQFSIKTTGEAHDARRWSEACKYTLTNIKWLCLWSVSHSNASSKPPPATTKT